MKTLWSKGTSLDEAIAAFTVGDDRLIDAQLARHDLLGSLAHVQVLAAAHLLTPTDAEALTRELRRLYTEAERGALAPGPEDEDIHSCVERLLTEVLGDPGRRVHTARSRNDQVATDVALWMREQALDAHTEALAAVEALTRFAQEHAAVVLPGMTHLQPAMPSPFGLWAAGYAALLRDDAHLLRATLDITSACPLGSAAGYGVPPELAPIDRSISAQALAFDRVAEPATAVQGGRGKPEATLLFAAAQLTATCARLARDVVLYVHPNFGWLSLPRRFTTGSSIMPQKRNPDVLELIRGTHPSVQAALMEVLQLASSVPSGYHRDFQLLKGPLLRGIRAARGAVQMVAHVVPGITVDAERAKAACSPELYATHRALELVVSGQTFRDAYRQVSTEVDEGSLPDPGTRPPMPLDSTLAQLHQRTQAAQHWQSSTLERIEAAYGALLGRNPES
ncbi:MAG: argininosuccinate lyase [Myxococcota bacterium]